MDVHWHIRALMKMKCIVLHRDGLVDEEAFEEAEKKADESFPQLLDAERAEKFRRIDRCARLGSSSHGVMHLADRISTTSKLYVDCTTRAWHGHRGRRRGNPIFTLEMANHILDQLCQNKS